MKVTVVPAQVTTVEDKVAGNLGLSQLMLLSGPVFFGSALFAVLPPAMHSAPYKIVLVTALLFVCSPLAIRIKGRIVLLWLVIILRYNLRPTYYVANKNNTVGREQYLNSQPEAVDAKELTARKPQRLTALHPADALKAYTVMDNPSANIRFAANKKGGLYVRITEVKN